jgi:hypothetical protein
VLLCRKQPIDKAANTFGSQSVHPCQQCNLRRSNTFSKESVNDSLESFVSNTRVANINFKGTIGLKWIKSFKLMLTNALKTVRKQLGWKIMTTREVNLQLPYLRTTDVISFQYYEQEQHPNK